MKKLGRLVLGLAALALVPVAAEAQNTGTITGRITDQSTAEPLAGVQVFVAGTNLSSISDREGRYTIRNVQPGTVTVRAVLIGYGQADVEANVPADGAVTADLALRASAIDLDAIVVSVVTGRAERKRTLGTNSATITASDLERAPITSMADVLVARAPSVQLQGVAGSIGGSQRIRIRGANSISLSNEPLVFVDGIQFSNNKGGFGVGGQDYSRLNDLNPDDIENIEVLKGPAASALYGTAAANGVIQIRTRRGTSGATRWTANVEWGRSEDPTSYPLNYMTVQTSTPGAPIFTPTGTLNREAHTFCPNESAASGACTQDAVEALNPFDTPGLTPFQDGSRRKLGLSVSGGGDALTYFVSGDFDTQEGVIYFNTQDRLSVRANIGARVLDNLRLDLHSNYMRSDLALNANDNNIFSPLINGLLASPFVPTQEQRDNSSPGLRPGTGFGYFIEDIEENISFQEVDRFMVGATTGWQPLRWLDINTNIGLDYFSRFDNNTVQPGRLPIAATWTPGFRQAQRSSSYFYTMNAAGVGTFELSPTISSTTTLGTQYTREQFEGVYCYGVGIVEGTRSCSATSSLFDVDEEYSEVRTIGAYLQQQLAWRDRLFLAASVRGDDNSAFGQDFGFIYYPGASVSWVVSEEPFFPRTNVLSNLRLRTAYGMSGQRPNFRDAQTLLEPTSATVGGNEVTAVRLSRVGNIELEPERTTEFEVGFDAGFLEDRLALEFAYFQKRSRDALVARPLPPSYGLTGDAGTTGLIWDNLGSVKNWGTEASLNARLIQTPDVGLNLRLSASTLDNRIEDLGEDIQPITFNRNGVQQHKQGFPTGAFFGRRFEIANPGQQRLLTRDDVRLLDTDSVVFLGRSLPSNTQSLSADLSLFRNVITISSVFERRAGHYQLNDTERFRCTTGYSRGNAGSNPGMGQCAGVADPNASLFEQARFIAMRLGAVNPATNQRVTTVTGYIEPADFIKWREFSVTFAAPQSLLRSVPQLQGATLTLAGRNLATWTDYTGLDPEINETGGGSNFTQGEFNTQPPLRHFNIRFNYTF
jgi:TonB-dependent starch-binding outer membrane protein SusC